MAKQRGRFSEGLSSLQLSCCQCHLRGSHVLKSHHRWQPLAERAGQRPPQLPFQRKQAPACRTGTTLALPAPQAARWPFRLPPRWIHHDNLEGGQKGCSLPHRGLPRCPAGGSPLLRTQRHPWAPATSDSTLPFACKECCDSSALRVEYQGYFLKRKLTSNVCNWSMNIHDLLGGFHNYFILLRLIWSTVVTAVVYTPSSRCQQFGSVTFPVSCAGEQL